MFFPNPANDEINIKAAVILRGSVYTIYDSTEDHTDRKKSTENLVIDIEEFVRWNIF
ncbi:MAG: hypothetical protein IPN88_19385 [Bacteroidetes bacterium]|nr:hypothetical protein [Bacteroidota bacterium]